jgi:predicted glycosyltransferase
MARILVYSHDTYGLGNIRRMLAIATELAKSVEDASVLVLSGSPMVQGFRIAPQIDYVKLPSVTRTARDGYATRSLGLAAEDVFELRANLALATVADFRPDVMLVDKKPFGVHNELEGAVYYAKTHLPSTSLVLVLRDILDGPEATRRAWRSGGFTAAIDRFYDRVAVLGTPDIFDMRREYALPPSVCAKLRFCGYIRRPAGNRSRSEVRGELGLSDAEQLVLVTPGGGEDGERVVRAYAEALPIIHAAVGVRSLIVTGPEMPRAQREQIRCLSRDIPGVTIRDFTDDMMSYLDASDLVVCMGGYNTLCEVATLRKRAIVVPRVRPVEEQWIRAQRLAHAGLVASLHPDALTPAMLAEAVRSELQESTAASAPQLDLTALAEITGQVRSLLRPQRSTTKGVAVPHFVARQAAVVEFPL